MHNVNVIRLIMQPQSLIIWKKPVLQTTASHLTNMFQSLIKLMETKPFNGSGYCASFKNCRTQNGDSITEHSKERKQV